MTDPRIKKLAENLVNFSCKVQKGENVLIEGFGEVTELVKAIVREVYAVGGVPFVWLNKKDVDRELALGATEEQYSLMAKYDSGFMSEMQVYMGIRGENNASEMSDVPNEKLLLISGAYGNKVHGQIRVPRTKWVVLRYPTPGMAQMASMSTVGFEDYYFNVCNLDYSKMDRAMDPLKALMERTDKVRIVGPGTDLRFSIKGMKAIKCAGEMNIPDGEIYTAPVKDSVEGVVTYNTPSPHDGFVYENVKLTFEKGKIVKAESNDNTRINQVFDMDEGARYVGEFALGVNPYITFPMKEILFDEKIAGSFHFTPGSCYEDCDNGNQSSLHWDLVCIQTPEYGGGEIYFDDVLIRKDGRFVLPELECLNPENLK